MERVVVHGREAKLEIKSTGRFIECDDLHREQAERPSDEFHAAQSVEEQKGTKFLALKRFVNGQAAQERGRDGVMGQGAFGQVLEAHRRSRERIVAPDARFARARRGILPDEDEGAANAFFVVLAREAFQIVIERGYAAREACAVMVAPQRLNRHFGPRPLARSRPTVRFRPA